MKKIIAIFSFILMFYVQSSTAQSIYGPTGTRLIYKDNGGNVEAAIHFADSVKVWPYGTSLPNYTVVEYAALEIVGIDGDNNEVPIIAQGTGFTSAWNGKSHIASTGSSSDPSIVTVSVKLQVWYHDPELGSYEVFFEHYYDPSTVFSNPININTDTW